MSLMDKACARIVIGLPVHNERAHIEEALRSLAAQDSTDFEVIISDNASNDGTDELCRSFAEGDGRFHYVRHLENIGAARNFMFCMEASSSDYFMWCGAHDVLSRNFVSAMSVILDENPSIALAFGSRIAIDENSVPIESLSDDHYVYRFSGNRFVRYIQSATATSDCTIVYGLFRRKYLDGFLIEAVQSCDKVLLSHLLFFGNLRYDFSATYARRFFNVRAATQAERIIGTQSSVGMDDESLVRYFTKDIKTCLAYAGLASGSWRERLMVRAISARYLNRKGRYIRFLSRLQVQSVPTLRALFRGLMNVSG